MPDLGGDGVEGQVEQGLAVGDVPVEGGDAGVEVGGEAAQGQLLGALTVEDRPAHVRRPRSPCPAAAGLSAAGELRDKDTAQPGTLGGAPGLLDVGEWHRASVDHERPTIDLVNQ